MGSRPENGIVVQSVDRGPGPGALRVAFTSKGSDRAYVETVDDVAGYMDGWEVSTPEGLADCLSGELEEVALGMVG